MESARKAPKAAPVPPQPAAARRPPPAPASRANALQSQIGASGVTTLLAMQAQARPPLTGPQNAPAGATPAAAPAHGASSAGRTSAPNTTRHDGATGGAASPGKEGHDGTPREKKGAARGHDAIPAEGGDKKPSGAEAVPLEGATGGGEGTATVVKLHMPEPPSALSKATQQRIAGVRTRAAGKAGVQASLPSGAKQVADARKAVTPPNAERIAAARAQLIASVHAAPSPEILKLAADIRRAIRDRRPTDEDSLVNAKPAKEASEAGNTLNTSVQGAANKVQDNYGSLNSQPQPAPAQPGVPVPPQPAAAPTAAVNAAAAVPDAVPAQNVLLDKDASATRKQAADAGMNSPAAAEVKSGPIAEARDAQGELDKVAAEDPAKVLAKQKEALAKADADMGALQMQALDALTSARTGTVTGIAARQHGMVGSEEQMRAQAGSDAKAVFDKAQSDVQALLKPLVPTAMDKWETAKAALTSRFKADLEIVKARVDERHSGVGGWFVGVWDAVTGLPGWATDAYDTAERNFTEGVIAKLTEISTEVNSVIKVCETIVENARTRIHEIFDALPESSKKWAAQEQAKLDGQLDKLGQEVVAARDGFNQDVSKRAAEAVDEVRAEIAALRQKAGGLVGRIVDAVKRFVDDPVKFIIEGLLEILGISPPAFWAVVAKIKKVVKDIVDDPIGFANNLLKGLGQGFSQFFDNFAEHMIRSFLSWLLGDLKDVEIPKEFSVKSIITLFLQIMGITWPNIRNIIAKKIGEKNVALIEKVYSLISMLMDQGSQGIYEMIKDKLDPQSIVDQVIQMAVDFMVTAIAKQVAVRVALLFNPAGAILQAIEAIYHVLKWVFENAARIFTLVETIVNGLADIIAGNVGGFAKAVERGLGMLIAPVLSFVADYFSLGDLPAKVAKQIKTFRKWILSKIEAGFDWLIAKAKALLAALGVGKKEKDKKGGSEGELDAIGENVAFSAAGEPHHLWVERHGANGVLMVASAKQPLEKFFASQKVKAALKFHKDKQLPKDIADAQATLSKTDHDIDALAKEIENIKKEKEGDPNGGDKLTHQNEMVKTEQRNLAEVLVRIFEALQIPEPISGEHRVKRTEGPAASGAEESHHVPAKALGQVMKEFLQKAQAQIRSGVWAGDPNAEAVAAAIDDRLVAIGKLSDGDGFGLSAILLSHESHKEDGGAHSRETAGALSGISAAGDTLLHIRRSTESKLKSGSTYISINPQKPGWRAFLVDVHEWVETQGSHRTRPDQPRPDIEAVQRIILQAGGEFSAISPKELGDKVVRPINLILLHSPVKAFQTGQEIVRSAMDTHEEGTPTGRAKALADLQRVFNYSWHPFRVNLTVQWP